MKGSSFWITANFEKSFSHHLIKDLALPGGKAKMKGKLLLVM